MLFVSQIITNVKQIAQCYSIYLTFVKMKIQCYSANLDLLYLYDFSKVADLNAFTVIKLQLLKDLNKLLNFLSTIALSVLFYLLNFNFSKIIF